MVPESELHARLRAIVGRRNVLNGSSARPFINGYRHGRGDAEAVVRPGSLVEMWRVAKEAVAARRIVIVQAANTGLTGGSTPDGTYDRPVILINTMRIDAIVPILGGSHAVCLAGATLHELERVLRPFDREPHSVIGSSCIGASVVGGICNNSGGALVRRGPAYTEYALFARVQPDGELELVNHLGIALGSEPEEILGRLDAGELTDAQIDCNERKSSISSEYEGIVRDVGAGTPARFNANPGCLFEASGSAGRVVVFAVRVETFPREAKTAVFYIGTNETAELTELRRSFLQDAPALPISGEYIHREAFDLADRFGKDTVVAIATLGTSRLPAFFKIKSIFDRVGAALFGGRRAIGERVLQLASRLTADHLPARMRGFRDRFEHHLILKVAGDTVAFAKQELQRMFPSRDGDVFECTEAEADRAMLHRFAVAGAAVRYRAVRPREVEDIVALDIALPRNCTDWFESLPPEISTQLVGKLYYGHFFCHVFHQDYLVRKGANPQQIERALLALTDQRGAEYPAEHNVGQHYRAKPSLVAHYRGLDPTNTLNPGIGKTNRAAGWA